LSVIASAPSARPWTQTADGIALDVRLTPRGGRDAIEGIEYLADGRSVLKARVRAAPVEGEANEALQRLIARELGIAPRQIELTGGGTARVKRLCIAGNTRELEALLERRLTQASTKRAGKQPQRG
jgi:uncharacterized protein YggU (UPF0235/DUF167 family)